MKRIAFLLCLVLANAALAEIQGSVEHEGANAFLVIRKSEDGKVIDRVPLRTFPKGYHTYHWTSDPSRIALWKANGRVPADEMKARLPSPGGNMGGGVYTATDIASSSGYGNHVFEFEAPEDEQIIDSPADFSTMCQAARVKCIFTDEEYKQFLIKSGVEGIRDFGHLDQDYVVWLDTKATSDITRYGESVDASRLVEIHPEVAIDEFQYGDKLDAAQAALMSCHQGLCEVGLDWMLRKHSEDLKLKEQPIRVNARCLKKQDLKLSLVVPAGTVHRHVRIDCQANRPSISIVEKPAVHVMEATWGTNLPGVEVGNATKNAGEHCDEWAVCGYLVSERFLPKLSTDVKKGFRIRWRCFDSPRAEVFEKTLSPETAENTKITLDCKLAQPPAPIADIEPPPRAHAPVKH